MSHKGTNDTQSYVITGSNRGIGLEVCKQLTAKGHHVIAICRHASDQLQKLGIDIIENIDVSHDDIISTLKNKYKNFPKIDVLINVSGILYQESLNNMNYETMRKQYEVNALGPIRITQALLSRLKTNSKIAFISSRMGSIEDNSSGSRYGYRMSKAALNAAAKSLAIDLKEQQISVAILHPGLVATEMTNYNGISTEESAAGLINRIEELNIDNSGTFWHAQGEVLPW